jgi:predicted site-specific integrase-resolvase
MKAKKPKKTILLTREETRSFLRISLATLHRWTNEGLLKAYHLGGKVYYKQHEIIQSLDDR